MDGPWQKRHMKKILVFGIFDGLHPGHIDFFRQAKEHGDFLIVAVGQTSAIKKFKNKIPKYSLKERIYFVQDTDYVDRAVPGDREQGSYKIILREKPNIICLGYDQKDLAEDLKRWLAAQPLHIPLRVLEAHHHDTYHSSILNGSSR